MSSFSTANTVRYIPEFDYINQSFNLNLAPNITYTNAARAPDILQPYRVWIRYTTTYWEWKLGLQKINFGPGKLLRSLQWFDQLDPRDPTNQTTGVWGLKSRYTSATNRSVWFWALMGNDKLKGWEFYKSNPDIPEFGGRLEQPLGAGELGLTSHWRVLNNAANDTIPTEFRVAVDGYIDLCVGLWFESSSSFLLNSTLQPKTMILTTLGADYTVNVGNGLYLTGEQMSIKTQSNDISTTNNLYALMSSYPISWLDNISVFITHSPKNDFTMVYLSWQRTLDRWIILISGYKTTEFSSNSSFLGSLTLPGFSGIQLMLTFNH
ncbi:MAG: hypothetical protein GWO85_01305 [Simkaniaceae bacterium]|nr:hypothetical protein [Simkaniaceae bacterium]